MIISCVNEKHKKEIGDILIDYGFSIITENTALLKNDSVIVFSDTINSVIGRTLLILNKVGEIGYIDSDVTVAADCDSKTVISLLKRFKCITVSTGISPINSVSVSSINEQYALVSVQRAFLTKSGKSAVLGEYRINTKNKYSAFSLACATTALIYEEIITI